MSLLFCFWRKTTFFFSAFFWAVEAIRSIALKVFGAPFYKKVRNLNSQDNLHHRDGVVAVGGVDTMEGRLEVEVAHGDGVCEFHLRLGTPTIEAACEEQAHVVTLLEE